MFFPVLTCLNALAGIVVEDCLLLMLNLLKNNSSNQNFFKEGSFIRRLPPYFELQPADQSPQGGWSAQKVTNIHLMLQVSATNSYAGCLSEQMDWKQSTFLWVHLMRHMVMIWDKWQVFHLMWIKWKIMSVGFPN